MFTAATATPSSTSFQQQHHYAHIPSASPTPTPSSPPVLPFHRRQLPATPSFTSQLPIPTNTATYSPLSSGLPSPNFPSPISLPAAIPTRGRSPVPVPITPSASRQPSRQQSVRRLSSVGFASRNPSIVGHHPHGLSNFSTISEDVLTEGDVIGEGDQLHGEVIESVHIPTSAPRLEQAPALHMQVVRRLGAGSYAVVYLVREIVSREVIERPPPVGEPEELSDSDSVGSIYRYTYGREFAVKCLSKATLSPEELEIQMLEAKLHQSLPTHPNIVTLYRTLQTATYLLLILESVPGEDLFYFLEQSRDSHPHPDVESLLNVQPSIASTQMTSRPLPPVPGSAPIPNPLLLSNALMISNTPPTPSLLSSSHPQHLLSYQRLRLITSMFSQMCDAVDACHTRGLSHRDIKPENFIVTEGTVGAGERKVVVKLSDFGLATTLQESADVDCGSAPYMSFECRNNVAPLYATQPADVWSLGIVLINMLYHHNPWSDTATVATDVADKHRGVSGHGYHVHPSPSARSSYVCSSFAAFIDSPVQFFLQRFPGMTLHVADFLANRVFCILRQPGTASAGYKNQGERISAREFGDWVKALPRLIGEGASLGFSLIAARPSGISRAGSKLAIDTDWSGEERGGSAVTTHAQLENAIAERGGEAGDADNDYGAGEQDSLRSPSTKRRGKRGAKRKDKSQPPSTPSLNPSFASLLDTPATSVVSEDDSLSTLAAAVEKSAAEISRSTRSGKAGSVASSRTGRSSRMSATEKALARLPPMPSIAPPLPPGPASVEGYREIGRKLTSPSQDIKPPTGPPQTIVDAAYIEKHAGVAAILGSAPALPRRGFLDRFRKSSTDSKSHTPHAAPHAHESPATITPSPKLRNEVTASSSSSSSSPTATNVKNLMSSLDPPRPTPRDRERADATLRAASRVVNPGMSWMSDEDEERYWQAQRPQINDLDVGPAGPSASTTWARRPPENRTRLMPAPVGRPPIPVAGSDAIASSRPLTTANLSVRGRAMDNNWRASHISTSTSTSGSGAASIINSAGTLSSNSSTYTASIRSFSTVATSVSGGSITRYKDGLEGQSWRTGSSVDGPGVAGSDAPPRPRKGQARTNVKRLDGAPYEVLSATKRIHGVLSTNDHDVRKKGSGHPSAHSANAQSLSLLNFPPLDSISERNNSSGSHSPPPSPELYRGKDPTVSNCDVASSINEAEASTSVLPPAPQKTVHKAPSSHAFQRVLSALKTKGRD